MIFIKRTYLKSDYPKENNFQVHLYVIFFSSFGDSSWLRAVADRDRRALKMLPLIPFMDWRVKEYIKLENLF